MQKERTPRVFSALQKAHQKKFAQAIEYAKRAMKDEALKSFYSEEAHKKPRTCAFGMAISHFFKLHSQEGTGKSSEEE